MEPSENEPHVKEYNAFWATVVSISLFRCIRGIYDGPYIDRSELVDTLGSIERGYPVRDERHYRSWKPPETIVEIRSVYIGAGLWRESKDEGFEWG